MNRDSYITPECVTAALNFAKWQERVRTVYSPSEARNDDAIVTDLMLTAFTEADKEHPNKWIKFWDIARTRNWSRKYGSSVVSRVKQALINDGFLVIETEEDENGNSKPIRNGRMKIRKA